MERERQMQVERGGATLVYVCRVVDQGNYGADSGQLKLTPHLPEPDHASSPFIICKPCSYRDAQYPRRTRQHPFRCHESKALLGHVLRLHTFVHLYSEHCAICVGGRSESTDRSMELPALGLDFWSWLDNGSCHRRVFPFADHDGVHFLREGVIVFTLCLICVCCS